MASIRAAADKRSRFGSDFRRHWKDLLAESVVSAAGLGEYFDVDLAALGQVAAVYPVRINPYFLSLIREKNDPIWRQAVPDLRELEDDSYSQDPLCEEQQSPVPNLVHRYPARVLFLASNQCAMFCRYCMRKRRMGDSSPVRHAIIKDALTYIRDTKAINEVILSGGDPLMLDDDALYWILSQLRSIAHIDILRIHTRIPSSLPQRVTGELVDILSRFQPVYVNIQFNHPAEITELAAGACLRLADAGVPLGCQTVLLKGVNDAPAVIKELIVKLIKIRVRPYYLHQGDVVRGTSHFRTSTRQGLDILKHLRALLPGFCIPQYVIDLPGGCGKIPLQPEPGDAAGGERLSTIHRCAAD